jgi:hypothetical protein
VGAAGPAGRSHLSSHVVKPAHEQRVVPPGHSIGAFFYAPAVRKRRITVAAMRRAIALSVVAFLTACGSERTPTPTSPSQSARDSAVVAGPVGFTASAFDSRNGTAADPPPRNESLIFRQWLDVVYQGTPPTTTTVDIEGAIVWTQEYIVYRRSGCDDVTASSNTVVAIDRAPARQPGPPLCGPNGSRPFPDRADVNRFRQTTLEDRYRPAGISRQTPVNLEGDATWTMEYMRYRMGDCSHQVALDKIQIDINSIRSGGGGAPQPVCQPTPIIGPCGGDRPGNCAFQVDRSSVTVPAGGGAFAINVLNEPRPACTWAVETVSSFITVVSPTREVCATERVAQFQVAPNTTGTTRSGTIRVAGQMVTVTQASSNAFSASFVVLPNPGTGVQGEQCAVSASGSQNQMNCTFDASASQTTRPGSTFEWRFGSPSTVFTGERLSNPLLPCGSFGSLSEPRGSISQREVTLTVVGPSGSVSLPRVISFVRSGHC